ncbi:CU044_2847 family protein [Streptomyces sp. Ru73]|uniref:CU044_2847 family protein n=1 Tax=Streptomyces sp. Ru73 TaxID=2080748 RepID=UPI0015E273B4|nr:CU044_2847 family protein [Streptomyces sp. Ru73]
MSDFVEFNFSDGTGVLIEVWPTQSSAPLTDPQDQLPGNSTVEPVGIGARVVEQAGQALNDAFAPLVPVLGSLHEQVRRLPRTPEEVTVQFGVKLTAGLKLAIISGGEATFNVSASWRLSDAREGHEGDAPASSSE